MPYKERADRRKNQREWEDRTRRAVRRRADPIRQAKYLEVKHRSDLRRRYGLALDEYDSMLIAQDGLCAICRSRQDSQRLAVDHDHLTGVVRGLLCITCNIAVGVVREDPTIAMNLVAYLRRADEATHARMA